MSGLSDNASSNQILSLDSTDASTSSIKGALASKPPTSEVQRTAATKRKGGAEFDMKGATDSIRFLPPEDQSIEPVGGLAKCELKFEKRFGRQHQLTAMTGDVLVKHGRSGRPHKKFVVVSASSQVFWLDSEKDFKKKKGRTQRSGLKAIEMPFEGLLKVI